MLIREWGKFKSRILQLRGLEPPYNIRGATNGEFRLLSFLAALPESRMIDCLIDVGANVGDWTDQALRRFGSPSPNILCVEPIPDYVERLRQRFGSRPSVKIYEFALSIAPTDPVRIFQVGEKEGRFYASPRNDPRDISSTKKISEHMVAVTSGDRLFTGRRPYMIKFDCEGHDLQVLSGFQTTLQQARPVVQFEYCEFWIASGSRLKEACAYLDDAGYRTYRLFPDALKRFTYSSKFETFMFQNIVAIPNEFPSIAGDIVSL
jgi:FkbM family methyltransferase